MQHQSPTFVDAVGLPIATRSLLLQVTANDSDFMDFTGLDTRVPRYVIEGDGIKAQTDQVQLNALFSISGVFQEGVDDYAWAARMYSADTGNGQSQHTSDSRIATCRTGNDAWGTGANETGDITFVITRGGSGNPARIWGDTLQISAGADLSSTSCVGAYIGLELDSAGIDGVRLIFDAGKVVQGNFRLYGVE
jgi:hypothetical protein